MWFLKEQNIYQKVTESSVNLVNGFFWNLKHLMPKIRIAWTSEVLKCFDWKIAGLNYQNRKFYSSFSLVIRKILSFWHISQITMFFFSESFEVRLVANQQLHQAYQPSLFPIIKCCEKWRWATDGQLQHDIIWVVLTRTTASWKEDGSHTPKVSQFAPGPNGGKPEDAFGFRDRGKGGNFFSSFCC